MQPIPATVSGRVPAAAAGPSRLLRALAPAGAAARRARRAGRQVMRGFGARLGRMLLAISIASFIAAVAYISIVIYQRQVSLARVSRYDLAWSASQAIIELERLEQSVTASLVTSDPDDVQLRYDIFVNRLTLLERGTFRGFAQRRPETRTILERLERTITDVAPLIDGLGRGEPVGRTARDRAALVRTGELLAPLTPALLALASAANIYGGELVARDQQALLRLHLEFSALVAGLIVAGIVLVLLLLWHNGLLERTHEKLRRTTRQLGHSRELLNAALDTMSQGLCMVDADQRLIVANRNFRALLMMPTQVVIEGRRFADLLRPLPAEVAAATGARDLIHAQLLLVAGKVGAARQEELPDGRVVAITHQPTADGGWLATYEDVTEQRRAQDRIAHIAHHDALTGLANRLRFHDGIDRAIARVQRGHGLVAVLCLDLDHFKAVNDTLGHPAGDALLRLVAARLMAATRRSDLVARLGGDEFAIIQDDIAHPSDAMDLARRLIEALSQPYDLHGQQVVIGTSVGIAIAPGDGMEPDTLMTGADLALYDAKADGRGTVRFFEPDMALRVQNRHRLERELRHAIRDGELAVFFQPFVDATEDRVRGFEALIRWRHPERGLLAPGAFIEMAEETGLIDAIGEFVLHQACAEAASWPDGLRVAVNLSAKQFRAPDRLVEAIASALASSGLPPQRLELEVTESVVLHASAANKDVLHRVRAMGVRIAMDDFGTGFSSLSYLRSFPFDKIKIDRSFVADMDNDADSKAIVRAVIGLASSLGMTTTAEGVEGQPQFAQLQRLGCTEIQGYLISSPIPAVEVGPFLRRRADRQTVAAPPMPVMVAG